MYAILVDNIGCAHRAKGKAVLRQALVPDADIPDPALIPDTGGALPEWAEELRGCDLPNCPVCALARKGYQ